MLELQGEKKTNCKEISNDPMGLGGGRAGDKANVDSVVSANTEKK